MVTCTDPNNNNAPVAAVKLRYAKEKPAAYANSANADNYRVKLGPFNTVEEANTLKKQLIDENLLPKDSFVIRLKLSCDVTKCEHFSISHIVK